MKNKIFILIFLIFLLNFISATQVCQIYDDFSSESLNMSKWVEILSGAGASEIEQHYVNSTDKNYHTAQTFTANNGVQLKMLQPLQSGDTLEFDLIYYLSSGNHWGCAFWQGNADLTLANYNNCIGYWNGITTHSGEYGVYHYKASFNDTGININRTLPNGTIETNLVYMGPGITISPPYNFSVYSRTGSNGMAHFDYDNFQICTEVPEPTIEERINLLEIWKQIIEDWKTSVINSLVVLTSKISELTEKVDNHEKRIVALENSTIIKDLTPNYWGYLSAGERKNILCGYAKDNHLTSIADFGLSCNLIYKRKGNTQCKCKIISQ